MKSTTLARSEFVVAILLTFILVAFHLVFWFHAGPLWRDEISSLALAAKPMLSELRQSLRLDPFPASYFVVLRLWQIVAGETDLALRGLGLLIGLTLIGSLWFTSYLVDKSPPIWALVLFAFNPLTLEAGDSLRPYGFGLVWIVLSFGFLARIVFGFPNKTVAALAFAGGILSVQSNFTNALPLFAIVAGAVVVLARRRVWSRLALTLGTGAVALASLLPYLPVMIATNDWSKILANKNDLVSVVIAARDAIGDPGVLVESVWLALILAVLISAVVVCIPRTRLDLTRDRIIFGAVVLFVAVIATIGFFCWAKYLVFPRYFLALLALAALCVDIFWNAVPRQTAVRALGLCLALIVAITSFRSLFERSQTRMTNCDQIAAMLEQRAVADDLIIVTSPLYGISFKRYYHGRTNWVTLPQVGDLTLHRWDLLKQAMTQPDPVPDLVSRAENVLRAGHRIFLVGKLGPAPATEPEPLPPAPQSEFGWQMEAYTGQWKSELTYWIEHHALHGTDLPVDQSEPVNPFEHLGLFEVFGWRGD